eukprot:jgi/Astpho2/3721/Aster-04906
MAFTHIVKVLSLAAEIALTVDSAALSSIVGSATAQHMAHASLMVLERMDYLCSELSTVVIIQFLVWFFLAFKERVVSLITEVERKAKDRGEDRHEGYHLDRILVPIGSLSGWAIVLVGILASLQVLHINIQPLLAVGGVSGLAIGFGAQSVLANAITGISLFLTRPFIVGDRVDLKGSGGSTVVVGVVERIEPMRTTIRTDSGIPVTIPNKNIGEMIVSNESRLGKSTVQMNFMDPRLFGLKVGVRYDDLKKVPKITDEITAWFGSHPGVDTRFSYGARLASLGEYSVNISLTAHTTPTQSRSFGSFETETIQKVMDVIEQNGAKLAFPTSLQYSAKHE